MALQNGGHDVAAFLVRCHTIFIAADICNKEDCQKSKKFTEEMVRLLEQDKKSLRAKLDSMDTSQRLDHILGLAEQFKSSEDSDTTRVLVEVAVSMCEELSAEERTRFTGRMDALTEKHTITDASPLPVLPEVPDQTAIDSAEDAHVQPSAPPEHTPSVKTPLCTAPGGETHSITVTPYRPTYEPTQYDNCGVSFEAMELARKLAANAASLLEVPGQEDVKNIKLLLEKALDVLETEDIC